MAALSSMIKMRRLTSEVGLSTDRLRGAARQLENERRAASQSVALGAQGSAELLGRERAVVKAETVPGLASREAMRENAVHILCENTHAIVNDGDAHAV